MHDALSTSDANGTLIFAAKNDAAVRRYRFALRTADFLLCNQCGVYIGAVIETESGRFGIINTHALKEVPRDMAAVEAIDYDHEDGPGRIDRRERRWTPVTGVPW